MRRFSAKWFLLVTALHLIASILWISAARSAGFAALDAEKHGVPIPSFPSWFTILSWILVPIPRLLAPLFHFGPSRYFYFLILPWSIFVGVCCGFFIPRLLRWHRESPNHAMERTTDRSASTF
jgi:hypothetical protein